MSDENPTLKIRLKVSDSAIGKDCHTVAGELLRGQHPDYLVLDAKWGRVPTEWYQTRTWGRPKLSRYEQGYVNGVKQVAASGHYPILDELLGIIDRLTNR